MIRRIVHILILIPMLAMSTDTATHALSVEEFISVVKAYHPIARQAQLVPERAKAELLIARGGWDPKIYSNYDRKSYNDKNYYSYFENSVSVPVWYGVEVKAGYDYIYGVNVNSESQLPPGGLGYVGVSVPLLKNMLIDKQRATLRQAQIFRSASEQQRLIILNDLLLDALNTYYDWSYAYNEYLVYKDATQVADVRFEATKAASEAGDRAAIDTTEALTQLQLRQFQLNESRLKFLNKGLELSNYLWLDNGQPRGYDTAIIPAALSSEYTQATIDPVKADEMTAELRTAQPMLMNYRYQLQQLDIERRLKLESLKPTLNANYNLLSEKFSIRGDNGFSPANNYKFGLSFNMPLTFMQARGDLKIMKLKIREKQYELDLKTQELVNKMKATFNELINLQQQTILYEKSLEGYRALWDGETTRFLNGESSVFLVNARENRYLDAQVKLRELQAKYYQKESALKWLIGNISTEAE